MPSTTLDQRIRDDFMIANAILTYPAASPAAYTFFSRTMMNLREKDDALAAGFGGFMAGGVLGLPSMYSRLQYNSTDS